MTILPLLPEPGVEGGRPAAGLSGTAVATMRIGARVVGLVGAEPLIETGHGRALLHGGPALRPGADLVLELQQADPALARTGRLVAVGEQRLEPGLPVRVQPLPPTQAVADVRSAPALEVSVRVLGADGRTATPAVMVRLSAPLPQQGPVAPVSSAATAVPSDGAAVDARLLPGASGPGSGGLPTNVAVAPVTGAPPAGPAVPLTLPPATAADAFSTARVLVDNRGVLAPPCQAVEAIVLPPDALGRTLLRAAGVTLQIDTPLDLPAGARLQLALPAGLARSSAAPLPAGPLEAVRTLVAWLREPADTTAPAHTALRLPEPSATLAARLLRLVELIAPRAADVDARSPAMAATTEGPAGARITAALAELGRLAGQPQSGGWRVLLLPLGFDGAPPLRLYVREDSCEGDGRRKDRRPQPSAAARRAVFELEFAELGRCQIDVLCQARRFDLLIRTAQRFPSHLRRDIRELYLAARDIAGLAGGVRFRAGQLLPLPEPGAAGGPAGGITV